MGHIQIAAGDDRLDRVQRTKAFAESIVPRHTMVDALQAILRVRRIASDKIKIRIFQRDHPALVVEFVDADAVGHGEGLSLREDRRAGIALLLSRAPELLIARQARSVTCSGWSFVSCRQNRSASASRKKSRKPFCRQARSPLTFHEIHFIVQRLLYFLTIHRVLYQIMTTMARENCNHSLLFARTLVSQPGFMLY